MIDARFQMLVQSNAWVQKLHGGMLWAEGPVYFADGNYLLSSDIPNNRIMQYVEGLGVRIWREATAIPVTAAVGWSPANMAHGASRAPSRTAASRCWLRTIRANC